MSRLIGKKSITVGDENEIEEIVGMRVKRMNF